MHKSEASIIVAMAPGMGQPLPERQVAPFLLPSTLAEAKGDGCAAEFGFRCSDGQRVRLSEPDKEERAQVCAHVSGSLAMPCLERDRVLVGRPQDRGGHLPPEPLQRKGSAAASVSAPAADGEEHGVEEEADDTEALTALLQLIMRVRRLRSTFLEETLFADPAWDMMLDLMEARLRRVRVSISSLCMAGGVPTTTALRWIKVLTDKGVLVRKPDAGDRRRIYVELSDAAAEAMMGWLAVARQNLARAGV